MRTCCAAQGARFNTHDLYGKESERVGTCAYVTDSLYSRNNTVKLN